MIEFHQVSKQYSGTVMAVSELSFSVAKGELVFLAGPSGAGKSTLLKLIGAIERPSAGNIHVSGQNIGQIKASGLPYLRRKLGLIFQQQRLLMDRNVLANVMLPLIVTGTARDDAEKRARAALDKIGLLDKASSEPLSLSGGEQQRVAIARAIVHRPQIILADEPTANLDRGSANKVLDTIKAFHHVGVTCLISTHDEHFLDRADRVICLSQGRIAETWRRTPVEAGAA
ncbi:MAG: ATP-binding cassette domain-containing protein [Pseudomonadota bacterium]